MMTFYNDITFIYAAQYEQNDHTQIARRQLVPGPENNQSLPDAGASPWLPVRSICIGASPYLTVWV